jgi:hypothetical protein
MKFYSLKSIVIKNLYNKKDKTLWTVSGGNGEGGIRNGEGDRIGM